MLSVTPGPRGHSQPGPPRTRVTVRELIQHHRRQSCSQGEHYGKRAFPEEHNHSPPPDFLGCKRRPPVNAAWETAVNEPSSAAATPSGPGVPLIRHPYVVQGGWGPSSPPPPPQGVSDGEVSLFQWQVLKQSREMSHVTSEMLDVQDEDGDTYLHIAVAQGRRALAYVLAEKNRQSIDTKDRNGQSALQIAVLTNQHLIVQDLLQLGASVNTRDHWGRSPLHVCAERGHVLSLQTIHNTLLLGDGQPIEIDLFNYEGMTPLHVAVTSFNRLVRELRGLERGVCSLVAMELARRRRWYMDIVHTLLLTGAQCGTKDQKNGKTSLHLASEEANKELFPVILAHPSSSSIVNEKMYSGNTALHIVGSLARDEGLLGAVRLLLRHGADPSARNLENEQPVHLVPRSPVCDKVRKLIKGKRKHALYLALP